MKKAFLTFEFVKRVGIGAFLLKSETEDSVSAASTLSSRDHPSTPKEAGLSKLTENELKRHPESSKDVCRLE